LTRRHSGWSCRAPISAHRSAAGLPPRPRLYPGEPVGGAPERDRLRPEDFPHGLPARRREHPQRRGKPRCRVERLVPERGPVTGPRPAEHLAELWIYLPQLRKRVVVPVGAQLVELDDDEPLADSRRAVGERDAPGPDGLVREATRRQARAKAADDRRRVIGIPEVPRDEDVDGRRHEPDLPARVRAPSRRLRDGSPRSGGRSRDWIRARAGGCGAPLEQPHCVPPAASWIPPSDAVSETHNSGHRVTNRQSSMRMTLVAGRPR
jgi:hypothetical protein